MNRKTQAELERMLGKGIFEQVPFNVAVIDRDYNIVLANDHFVEFFGDWHGKHCYEVYKQSPEKCLHCQARATFADGRPRVSDEAGVDRQGRACHYVVHLAPLRDSSGEVRYVIEMTTDLTETRHWQREYDLFFERVPCLALIIDRNYRVMRANEKFRETFGEAQGRHCYEACKHRAHPCTHCPAEQTFRDGQEHTAQMVGVQKDGRPAYYVVKTSPLSRGDGEIAHVIETAVDVTQQRELELELEKAHHYNETLVRNSATGIIAVDEHGAVKIMNAAARSLVGWPTRRLPSADRLRDWLPQEFFECGGAFGEGLCLAETVVRTIHGDTVPVRFSVVHLRSGSRGLGRAAFLEDLRGIKRLEQEKLEAERLGAVGQTVAGLAHTIKNLLMGLEGGMYMVDTGLRRGDAVRIVDGWGVLQRNFEKTTSLVKDFLSFAKGRLPALRPTDPNELARSIVDLYRDAAAMQGVTLRLEAPPGVSAAPLDPDGMETCLTNLVSNGIDAAIMRDEAGGEVTLRTGQMGEDLVFEVADNGCGMDWETKGKVFTTFFTTKGGKGTGLGLLTTRKIVQEHGGRIEVESLPGQGSTFRIRLPRKRLETLAAQAAADEAALVPGVAAKR